MSEMDIHVTDLKRKLNEAEAEGKRKDDENIGNTSSQNSKLKYDPMHLSLGFTYKVTNGQERPLCLLCMNTLASDSMKPNKLKRNLEKVRADHVGKTREFFQRKLENLNKQQEIFSKTMSVTQTGFSTVELKTKYRSRLMIEKELRTAISSMIPWFEKICAEKRAQPFH